MAPPKGLMDFFVCVVVRNIVTCEWKHGCGKGVVRHEASSTSVGER